MSSATATQPHAKVRKYELGRPFVRREQRLAFEQIHRTVAQTWSEAMTQRANRNVAFEPGQLEFLPFSSVAPDPSPCAQIVLFSIASTPISGFLMMTGALAKLLVNSRLGLKSAAPDQAAAFTRIETAVARETTRTLIRGLSDAYIAAKLGKIGNLRQCENLADSFLFAPEESLALLEFRVGAASDESRVLLGLNSAIVNSMSEHHQQVVAPSDGRDAIVSAVRRLPLQIEVVLGSWKVPLGELLRLRVGEKIVLPDGEDAWLSARGVRLRRANIEIAGNRATIEIRGRRAVQ